MPKKTSQHLEHKDFVNLFNVLFDTTHIGLCFGLGQMARRAMSQGEKKTKYFNNILKLINENIMNLASYDKETFIQNLKAVSSENLPISYWDIMALLTNTELYHKSQYYPVLFPEYKVAPQDLNRVDTLLDGTSPDKSKLIDKFAGDYTIKELEAFFDSLHTQLNACDRDTLPFVITLHSGEHLMTMGYSFLKEQWMLFDANEMPIIYESMTKKLPQIIFKAFEDDFSSKRKSCGFNICIYGNNTNVQSFKAIVSNWKKTPPFSNAKFKAKINKQDVNVVWLAAASGDNKTLRSLSKNKSYQANSASTKFAPLAIAAQGGNHKSILLLMQYGAKINAAKSSNPPIYIAAQYGHTHCVAALLSDERIKIEKGSYINLREKYNGNFLPLVTEERFERLPANHIKSTKVPVSPLLIAYLNGHDDIVSLLCAHAMNHDKPIDTSGNTPLHFALWVKDISLTLKLLKQGANTKAPNIYDKTPFDFCRKDSPCAGLLSLYYCKHHREKSLQKKSTIFTSSNKSKIQEQVNFASQIIISIEQKTEIPLNIRERLANTPHLKALNNYYHLISPLIDFQITHNIEVSSGYAHTVR